MICTGARSALCIMHQWGRLQLNLYRWILQSYYNEVVASMSVVCTHTDNGSAPFVDIVPTMDEEAEAMMRYQRGLVQEQVLRAYGLYQNR